MRTFPSSTGCRETAAVGCNEDLPVPSLRDEHWWHNDGALNTISMLYPRFPTPHPHCLIPLDHPSAMQRSFQPGIWYEAGC